MLMSHTKPETDGLFHSAAVLLYLLFCIDLLLGQPKIDMALLAVVLFPQYSVAAVLQLAALAVPFLLPVLYGSWAVICALAVPALALHEGWLVSPMVMTALLSVVIKMCFGTGHRQARYLLGAVLLTSPLMTVGFQLITAACLSAWPYISTNMTDGLHLLMQLCCTYAPAWFALAEQLSGLSLLRFLGLPTLNFISDTFFSEEKLPAKRVVSITRVYTSIGMLCTCCSENMAHSLLLLLLLKGGVEPNPGPAMNILAICAMMVLSPRPRNSLDLAGAMELMSDMFSSEARSPTTSLSDLQADFMKDTPYKRLGMPVSRLKSRYGKEVGPDMISSFEALFGTSYGECCLEDLPKLAQSARDVPGTWVTTQCQHRWLLVARALQLHNRSTKSALNNNAALWCMLAKVTDPVGHLFKGAEGVAAPAEAAPAQTNQGPAANGPASSPGPFDDELAYESDHLEPWERPPPDSSPEPTDSSQRPSESTAADNPFGSNPVRPARVRKRRTSFVDEYGDYDSRIQDCDSNDNPIDSDSEDDPNHLERVNKKPWQSN